MYPNLRYAFQDLFGVDLSFLALIQTYGFFLAFTFLMCAWALSAEFKRRESIGILQTRMESKEVGKPLSLVDLFSNALLGFLLGFKGLYAVMNADLFSGEQSRQYLLSMEHGSWLGGIGLAALFAFAKWREKRKELAQYPQPQTIQVEVAPHERVSDIIILAAVSGIVGAKLLYMTENSYDSTDALLRDLFSGSGLSVQGGFILAFLVVSFYIRQKELPWRQVLDAAAPAMILGTGLGRLGCHFSGDGDWGIENPAPNPGWLPDWLWAYSYPNNVIMSGVPMEDCGYPEAFGGYCNVLAVPVYPTALYELGICLLIFAFMWVVRHRVVAHGLIFSLYLIFSSLERFLLEFIRINEKYTYFGATLSQSQFIAIVLMVIGVILLAFMLREQRQILRQASNSEEPPVV